MNTKYHDRSRNNCKITEPPLATSSQSFLRQQFFFFSSSRASEVFCMQLTAIKPLYYLCQIYLLHLILCLMKYFWIGCLNVMVLQGRLYKNCSHPTCHLVHNLFKLNVQDLLYVNSIVVYRRGLSSASVICFVHRSPVADIIKRHNPTISMLMTLSSICHLNQVVVISSPQQNLALKFVYRETTIG